MTKHMACSGKQSLSVFPGLLICLLFCWLLLISRREYSQGTLLSLLLAAVEKYSAFGFSLKTWSLDAPYICTYICVYMHIYKNIGIEIHICMHTNRYMFPVVLRKIRYTNLLGEITICWRSCTQAALV